ncbi:putative phage abortive infection protein [Vibrio alginolyticus]|uniref:putative phage abortive infection protein n=1 Tax=Vibrio alginolyticus TaxID=663 RepID=UPI001BD32CE6|nr:putative phage abortive infection protein [Vibrio alginolyticus]MBS9828918.1 hypothetical protein [Vibrio alginolyticus]
MSYKNLKYKSYEGTVTQLPDGKFEGKVIGFNSNEKYVGRDLSELEAQFKNRVDYFYEHCAMLGVEPEQLGRRKPSKVPYLALFFSAIFVMCFLWWFYTSEFPLAKVTNTTDVKVEWFDKSGSFFNNFSAPILSFFSFMGLLFTIYQQNRSHQLSLRELALTREELELTRKEIEKTTIANEQQAEALRQQVDEARSAAEKQKALATEQRLATQVQQFEASFYALLAEHNKALEALATIEVNKIKYYIEGSDFSDVTLSDIRSLAQDNAELNRYFRMLYQLLKFIATNNIHNKNRDFSDNYLSLQVPSEEKRYASLVRSMIPNGILGLLAANCCEDSGSKKFYHKYFLLVERYSYLEHFRLNKLSSPSSWLLSDRPLAEPNLVCSVLQNYSPKAFGLNESLSVFEKQMENWFKVSNPRLERVFFELGSGRSKSVYNDLLKKYMPEGSTDRSLYGE